MKKIRIRIAPPEEDVASESPSAPDERDVLADAPASADAEAAATAVAFVAETAAIRVTASPSWREEETRPERGEFAWSYSIRIDNRGDEALRLESRQWHVVDANGARRDVGGEGVVGKRPIIGARRSFSYASGVSLSTPSGMMWGSFLMRRADGSAMRIAIPAFPLDSPHDAARPN